MWKGIGIGLSVAVLNGLIAWLLLRWSLARGGMLFVPVFLGGMVGRLFLVGAISILLLQYTSVHRAAYAASLLGGYLIFLVVEVVYVQRKGKDRKVEKTT